MKKRDLISIVIPCYNSQNCVERCIDSIMHQTYDNFEVLAINDGSKDDTLNILKTLEKKYKKLNVIDKKNGGAASARNLGIEKAKGEYIVFIDADDYIGEEFIEKYYSSIKENDYDMVVGGYTRLDENLNVTQVRKLNNKRFSSYILLSPWARIIKREFLKKNNITFLPYDMGEDVYFCMKILLNTEKVKTIDDTNYFYIYSDTSLTSTKFQDFKISQIPLLDSIIKECHNKEDKRFNYFMYRYVIYYLLTYGKKVKSERFVEETDNLFKYLKANNIKKVSIFSRELSGDDLFVKITVSIFKTLYLLKLIPLFSKVYCKKN